MALAVGVLLTTADVAAVRQLDVVLITVTGLLLRGLLRTGPPRQNNTQPLGAPLQRVMVPRAQAPPLHLVVRLLPAVFVLVARRPHAPLLEHLRRNAKRMALAGFTAQRRILGQVTPQRFLRVGIVVLLFAIPVAGPLLNGIAGGGPLGAIFVRLFTTGALGGPGLLLPGPNVGEDAEASQKTLPHPQIAGRPFKLVHQRLQVLLPQLVLTSKGALVVHVVLRLAVFLQMEPLGKLREQVGPMAAIAPLGVAVVLLLPNARPGEPIGLLVKVGHQLNVVRLRVPTSLRLMPRLAATLQLRQGLAGHLGKRFVAHVPRGVAIAVQLRHTLHRFAVGVLAHLAGRPLRHHLVPHLVPQETATGPVRQRNATHHHVPVTKPLPLLVVQLRLRPALIVPTGPLLRLNTRAHQPRLGLPTPERLPVHLVLSVALPTPVLHLGGLQAPLGWAMATIPATPPKRALLAGAALALLRAVPRGLLTSQLDATPPPHHRHPPTQQVRHPRVLTNPRYTKKQPKDPRS